MHLYSASSFLTTSCLALCLTATPPTHASGPLAEIGPNGQVILIEDSNGDRIPDFAWCGYGGGGTAIPDVPVRARLSPQPTGDDTSRIQHAINTLGKREPDINGFRGTLLLQRGTYRVEGSLQLNQSGVVLRGEGQGPNGTIIIATGTDKRTLITLSGGDHIRAVNNSNRNIAAERTPAGTRILELEHTNNLKPGDRIHIVRTANDLWIKTLGMDSFRGDDNTPWTAREYTLTYEREIVAIRDNAIGIDAPIPIAIENKFGGGYVAKVNTPRINHVAVENIRLISEYQKGQETSDENHAWTAIVVNRAEDSWIRNVTGQHFGYGTVRLNGESRRITVADCANLDPVSRIQGGTRYSFIATGQQGLVIRCYSREGRHDFVQHARASGPNAFVDCYAENAHGVSEPHHRFSTGTLFDNVIVKGPRSGVTVGNRGNSGTGHGWSGAWVVLWNCGASVLLAMDPPTARNAIIGARNVDDGDDGINTWHHWFENQSDQKLTRIGRVVHDNKSAILSPEAPVQPRSLFLQQTTTLFGQQGLANVATPVQINGNWDDIQKYLKSLAK